VHGLRETASIADIRHSRGVDRLNVNAVLHEQRIGKLFASDGIIDDKRWLGPGTTGPAARAILMPLGRNRFEKRLEFGARR
jgi:hypothetical protein